MQSAAHRSPSGFAPLKIFSRSCWGMKGRDWMYFCACNKRSTFNSCDIGDDLFVYQSSQHPHISTTQSTTLSTEWLINQTRSSMFDVRCLFPNHSSIHHFLSHMFRADLLQQVGCRSANHLHDSLQLVNILVQEALRSVRTSFVVVSLSRRKTQNLYLLSSTESSFIVSVPQRSVNRMC